jgi:hypothetical protein
MNRRGKSGVLTRVFEALQREGLIRVKMEAVCPDSASVKVRPNGAGALKKAGNKASGGEEADLPQKFIWSPRLTVRL